MVEALLLVVVVVMVLLAEVVVFKWLTWDDPSHGRVATTQIKKDGQRAKTATRFVKIPRDTFLPIFYQGASFLGCL